MSLVYAACPQGVEAVPVTVEVDVRTSGLRVSIVGLPDVATRESKDRLIPAITNSGFALDEDEIVINLGPADLRKEGTAFDLAMALGILVSKGIVPREKIEGMMVLGELSLDGGLRPVRGVLAAAECARAQGFKGLLVPRQNALEASLVPHLPVYELDCLSQLVHFLRGRESITPILGDGRIIERGRDLTLDCDLADVKGHAGVKRVLEIAAAGKHNVLMFGPPGSGKSMMGKRLVGILPPMSAEEIMEVTRIYSCAGKLKDKQAMLTRPFRSPHHTASAIALVGGGTYPRPGEVTQAHRGVLFLDEFPEFPRLALEVLRQPLEDRRVTVSRASSQLTFPADFILVAAMNPCPCGWHGDARHRCECSQAKIKQYRSRLSGPLLDRIDIHVEVPALTMSTIRRLPPSESSASVRKRVLAARSLQTTRFGSPLLTNGIMNGRHLERYCYLPDTLADWLDARLEKRGVSKRVHDKIMRVARTIADLDAREFIEEGDLMEALTYRQLDAPSIPIARAVREVI